MPVLSFFAFYSCRLPCRRVSRETSAAAPLQLIVRAGEGQKQAYFPLAACNLLSVVHCSPHLSPAIFLCVTLFDQLVEPLKQAIKLA